MRSIKATQQFPLMLIFQIIRCLASMLQAKVSMSLAFLDMPAAIKPATSKFTSTIILPVYGSVNSPVGSAFCSRRQPARTFKSPRSRYEVAHIRSRQTSLVRCNTAPYDDVPGYGQHAALETTCITIGTTKTSASAMPRCLAELLLNSGILRRNAIDRFRFRGV